MAPDTMATALQCLTLIQILLEVLCQLLATQVYITEEVCSFIIIICYSGYFWELPTLVFDTRPSGSDRKAALRTNLRFEHKLGHPGQ